MTVFAYNTIYPYGNMADWNLKKMVDFYESNPNWLCDKSGLSVISLDKTADAYKKMIKIYEEFKTNDNSIENWLNTFMKTKAFRKHL